jgi:glycosyltransferase involved in cell wall biosynthesis
LTVGTDDAVALTTIPIVADVVGNVPVKRWVYFCVDDFSVWPGLDSTPLRELETKLVARADRVVAAGDNLAERLRTLGRDPAIITHGIDLDHWQKSVVSDSLLADLPRPVVLFWGLIDRRLDVNCLRALAARITGGTIALVGPEQDPDPALEGIQHLRRLGPVTYDRLPAVAAGADVLVMPYADLPVTRAMQPLKLKEYLATGRPVIATSLPAVAAWNSSLDVASGCDEFAELVLRRIQSGVPDSQTCARQMLGEESWQSKAQYLSHLLFEP